MPPRDLAARNRVITNARIVTGAGTVLGRGSIVVLDGRIVSVAAGGPGILELQRRVENGALKGPRIITSGRVDPDNFGTEDVARAQVRTDKR